MQTISKYYESLQSVPSTGKYLRRLNKTEVENIPLRNPTSLLEMTNAFIRLHNIYQIYKTNFFL